MKIFEFTTCLKIVNRSRHNNNDNNWGVGGWEELYERETQITREMIMNTHLDLLIISWVIYTVGHEVMSRPCKIWDWLLNLSQDHFGLH